jgi:hypothetical protein
VPLTWTSSTPAIGTVDSFGTVKALTVGMTTIAVSAGGKTAGATLTVTPSTAVIERVYADITLKNGKLFVWRRDSAGQSIVRVLARNATTPYRSGGYDVRLMMAGVYAEHLRELASTLATRSDTTDVTTRNPLFVARVRCARVGCWVTVTNVGRTGYWTSSPKLPAAYLFGLAKALQAAAAGAPFTAADSLPYIRTVP